MAKSREILLSAFFALSLLGVPAVNPNVFWIITIFLVAITKGLQRLTPKNSLLIAFIFLLILDFFLRGNTLPNNYLIFGVYLSTFFDGKVKLTSTTIYHLLDFILVLNIALLILYPGATKWINYPEHLNAYGYPNWIRYLLINTVGSFIVVLMSLYRNKNLRTLLVLTFLLLSTKTTALLLLIIALIQKNFDLKNIWKYSLPFLSLVYFVFRYDMLDSYIMDRLYALQKFDINSEYLSRILLGSNSVNTFLHNPLVGIGYYRIPFEDHTLLFNAPIGHHSHLLDFLGRFGTLFVPIVILELARYKKDVRVIVLFWIILNNIIGIEWIMFTLILPSLKDLDENTAFSSRFKWRGHRKGTSEIYTEIS